MHGLRTALATCLGIAMVLTIPTPGVAAGGAARCRVRNVEQGTVDGSLRRMVRASQRGDHLRVRGVCRGGIAIRWDLTVAGRGGAVVDGRDALRGFLVDDAATVTLRGLTIRHVLGAYDGIIGGGAGIYNEGTATIQGVRITHARAGESMGGAVANLGTMRIVDTVIERSSADWGGAIGNRSDDPLILRRVLVERNSDGIDSRGPLTIVDSVIRENRGRGVTLSGTADAHISGTRIVRNGGGLSRTGRTTTRIEASLIAHNVTPWGDGGGIFTRGGNLVLIDTDVTDNRAVDGIGGGIHDDDGSTLVTLDARSHVTGNEPNDCTGTPAC